jgi:hypothetical protein
MVDRRAMYRATLALLLLSACGGGAPALEHAPSMSYNSHGESRVLFPFLFDSCGRAADRGSAVWRCLQKGDTEAQPEVQLDLVFRESFFNPSNLKFRSYPIDFELFHLSITPISVGKGVFANGGFEGELHIVPEGNGAAVLTGEVTQYGGGELSVAFNTSLTLPPE